MIEVFNNFGEFPQDTKYRTWLLEKILIKEGFTKTDIEQMELEEYEFHIDLILSSVKKDNRKLEGI